MTDGQTFKVIILIRIIFNINMFERVLLSLSIPLDY